VAIVTPKPQTTRNQITGILTEPRAQIVFLDTPGVHRMKGRMNRFLNLAAWQAVERADAVVVLADADLYARKPALLDKELAPLVEGVRRLAQPLFVAVNKTDLVRDKAALLPVLRALGELWPRAELFPVSAAAGQGVPELLDAVRAVLPWARPCSPKTSSPPCRCVSWPPRPSASSCSWPCARSCRTPWPWKSSSGRRSTA
jgi:GTP-binding protein Era